MTTSYPRRREVRAGLAALTLATGIAAPMAAVTAVTVPVTAAAAPDNPHGVNGQGNGDPHAGAIRGNPHQGDARGNPRGFEITVCCSNLSPDNHNEAAAVDDGR